MQVLLKCSFCICENVSLAIVLNALIYKGSAGGNGTLWNVGSLQCAILWLSVISLALILYHWCVLCDGVICILFQKYKDVGAVHYFVWIFK